MKLYLYIFIFILYSCNNRKHTTIEKLNSNSTKLITEHFITNNNGYSCAFLNGNSFSGSSDSPNIYIQYDNLADTSKISWKIGNFSNSQFSLDLETKTKYFRTNNIKNQLLKIMIKNQKEVFIDSIYDIASPINLEVTINDSVSVTDTKRQRRVNYDPLKDEVVIKWNKSENKDDKIYLILDVLSLKPSKDTGPCYNSINVNDIKLVEFSSTFIKNKITVFKDYRLIELDDEKQMYTIPKCFFYGLEDRNVLMNLRRVKSNQSPNNKLNIFIYNISADHIFLDAI